jgi:hypothetical protein
MMAMRPHKVSVPPVRESTCVGPKSAAHCWDEALGPLDRLRPLGAAPFVNMSFPADGAAREPGD